MVAISDFWSEWFELVWSTSHPNASYQVPRQLTFRFIPESRWRPWRPSWIADWKDFSYFCFKRHPDASHRFKSVGLLVQEKKRKIDFQDSSHSSHLGFLIWTILAFFLIYKSPWCFPWSKSIGLLVQEKQKIDFQEGGHLGFPIGTIFAIFDLPKCFQVSSQLAFQLKRRR